MARVGIFWGIAIPGSREHALIADATDLEMAEPYGDFLTHDRAHYDVWEAWKRLGARELDARGLPRVIAWSEYEEFPRGRIVYHTADKHFVIYADRRLQTRNFIAIVVKNFGLQELRHSVRSDAHYRRSV